MSFIHVKTLNNVDLNQSKKIWIRKQTTSYTNKLLHYKLYSYI